MQQTSIDKPAPWLYLLIAAAVLLNFSGLFVTIMGPDGTLYATIAKTMVVRHDYVNLVVKGHDWLDKPHFPFWVAALSYNFFGFTTWAYKLPAVLFLLMGAWYTYLFAKKLYNEQIALWSALILLTSQHILLSNNDVRAEAYLTGLIIAAVYHFYNAYQKNSWWQLLFGAVFAACAVMTKGLFALIPIAGAFGGQFIITKQWKQLFNLRWLVAAVLIIIFILPEIWCLYQQFDLHPEKTVFDQHHVSGIKFFFWDSQFGRFFNTGPIKGHGDPFFFVHTTLWAFLPWSLLLFAAIFQTIKKGIKNINGQEWFCIVGALLTFLVFSASKFQLPHYLNIVFPFFAIITAQYLFNIKFEKSEKAVKIVQTIVITLLILIVGLIQYFFRADGFLWIAMVMIALFILLLILPKKLTTGTLQRVMIRTVLVCFIVNMYLNLAFYPTLVKYQAGSEAAIWINAHNPNQLPVLQTDTDVPYPIEFYLHQPMQTASADGITKMKGGSFLLYTDSATVSNIAAKGIHTQTLKTFDSYWITRLKPAFLNYKTRPTQLTKTMVVLVNP